MPMKITRTLQRSYWRNYLHEVHIVHNMYEAYNMHSMHHAFSFNYHSVIL